MTLVELNESLKFQKPQFPDFHEKLQLYAYLGLREMNTGKAEGEALHKLNILLSSKPQAAKLSEPWDPTLNPEIDKSVWLHWALRAGFKLRHVKGEDVRFEHGTVKSFVELLEFIELMRQAVDITASFLEHIDQIADSHLENTRRFLKAIRGEVAAA